MSLWILHCKIHSVYARTPSIFKHIFFSFNLFCFKGTRTVRPDWICMRVVPLDRPLKGNQPVYVFDFLISVLNIWSNFQVLSRFIQKGLLSSCSKRDLFRRTVLQKFGRDINCSLDCSLRVKNFNISQSKPKYVEQHFGGFFHQIKVCQPIGRKDSLQTVNRVSRGLDLFLHEAAQNFELFSNIQDQN